MQKLSRIIFLFVALSGITTTHAAFVKQLVAAQEKRGIRVATPEEREFEQQVKDLSALLAQPLQKNNMSQMSDLLNSFYILFCDPSFIRFSTREVMNDFFEQLKDWHELLKKQNSVIPFANDETESNLKILVIQALKEICLFGRYSKNREENLVTFRLRLQYILTSIMLDADLAEWKDALITNNGQFAPGAFYSWDVQEIKSEFKDSAALMPLFQKLSASIDMTAEKQVAAQHAQEMALERERINQRKQQEASELRNLAAQAVNMPLYDLATREGLYLDCIRILLDPAYLDLSVADRKTIDKINENFKHIHTVIGKLFMPVLPQEGIDTLRFLVAKAMETIHSDAVKRPGGVAFKNHVEHVIKSLMTIHPNQPPTENKIKFQWIKPLYLDNPLLSAHAKKSLFALFNNGNYQRWLAGTRDFRLQLASPATINAMPDTTPEIVAMPVIEVEPVQPIEPEMVATKKSAPVYGTQFEVPATKTSAPVESEESNRGPITQVRKLPPIPTEIQPAPMSASPYSAEASSFVKTSADVTKGKQPEETRTTSTPPTMPATDMASMSLDLIKQALVGTAQTVQNILDKVQLSDKFALLMMTDSEGWTAVQAAASLGRGNIIETLLRGLMPAQRLAIVTVTDRDGQTALHLAAAAKNAPSKGFNPSKAVEELLKNLTIQQKKDFINMRDNSGATARDMAQGNNNKTVAAVLTNNLAR